MKVLEAPHGDLLSCMEMAKVAHFCRHLDGLLLSSTLQFFLPHPRYFLKQVADLIAFVVSAKSLYDGYETSSLIDPFGEQCLSVFRAIGLPSTAVLIRASI